MKKNELLIEPSLENDEVNAFIILEGSLIQIHRESDMLLLT